MFLCVCRCRVAPKDRRAMIKMKPADYLVDGRWNGDHGIARYSRELLARLSHIAMLTSGPPPMHPLDGLWTSWHIARRKPKAYYSPGYNAPLLSSVRYAFTIHDLTHLHYPQGRGKAAKKLFYNSVVKLAAQRSARIVTVSQFSKDSILEWANLPAERVTVIPNGCSEQFRLDGEVYRPGFPYLFFVGNQKPHKNVPRLLEAFRNSRASQELNLLFLGTATEDTLLKITQLGLQTKVIFMGAVSDSILPSFYRGAAALLFPSLYEGFGLPLIEAMACGTPTLTSNVSSMPEVANGSALLVDPHSTEAIANGIDEVVYQTGLRDRLRTLGIKNAARFSWSHSAARLQNLLFDLAYQN